ncbi:hypothetical protein BZA70DRAFT_140291 [Myxozyma melibiosi]|uniref:DM2 domain-containing protein n=1 Tax=Myxozyma melibiosi TaxID=54550 RepID=A0ABR1F7B6_9ASCO
MPTIPPEPFDASQYVPMIDAILSKADLDQITARRVRNAIQSIYDVDFTPFKKQIDSVIVDRFNVIQDSLEDTHAPASSSKMTVKKEHTSSSRPSSAASVSKKATSSTSSQTKSRVSLTDAEIAEQLHKELNQGRGGRVLGTTRTKRSNASSNSSSGDGKKRKVNRNNPFNARMLLSEPLAELLGQTELSRPECVKAIWAYIRENDLQNPRDKREILCDDRMRPVFGDKTHMFTMNKILGKHLYRREDVTGASSEVMDNDEIVSSDEDEDDEDIGAILKGE